MDPMSNDQTLSECIYIVTLERLLHPQGGISNG